MIRRIEAQRFRNLDPVELELESGSTLLVGPTGAGKTSVLEAIYVAASSRSFRAARLEECASSTPKENDEESERSLWVRATVERDRRSVLEVSWSPSRGLARTVDGERASIAEHLERQPVLAYTWQDGETWVGEPALRRRFIDRGLVAERTRALDALARYRKVAAHKRSLLGSARCRPSDLEPWNLLFAEAAADVSALRADHVARLGRSLREVVAASGLQLPGVELAYRPSPPAAAAGSEELLAALGRLAEREIEARRPLVGPHRDSIEMRFRRQPIGRLASSGERKALAVLAVSAQEALLRERRGAVLLIDDADTELDRPTLAGLWRVLGGTPQALFTSNRDEVWDNLGPSARVALSGGRVVGR